MRLSGWVNNQVEPPSVQPTKKLLEESGNSRFHKSGDIILTFNMVKSHFSFINCTDIVQYKFFRVCSQTIWKQTNGPWRTEACSLAVFGIHPYLMESIKRKIKKKIYMFSYFDESLIQQLKKTSWTFKLRYTRNKL